MNAPPLQDKITGPKVSAAMAWVIGGFLFLLGAILGYVGHFPLS